MSYLLLFVRANWTKFCSSWENGEFCLGQKCCTLFHSQNEIRVDTSINQDIAAVDEKLQFVHFIILCPVKFYVFVIWTYMSLYPENKRFICAKKWFALITIHKWRRSEISSQCNDSLTYEGFGLALKLCCHVSCFLSPLNHVLVETRYIWAEGQRWFWQTGMHVLPAVFQMFVFNNKKIRQMWDSIL